MLVPSPVRGVERLPQALTPANPTTRSLLPASLLARETCTAHRGRRLAAGEGRARPDAAFDHRLLSAPSEAPQEELRTPLDPPGGKEKAQSDLGAIGSWFMCLCLKLSVSNHTFLICMNS